MALHNIWSFAKSGTLIQIPKEQGSCYKDPQFVETVNLGADSWQLLAFCLWVSSEETLYRLGLMLGPLIFGEKEGVLVKRAYCCLELRSFKRALLLFGASAWQLQDSLKVLPVLSSPACYSVVCKSIEVRRTHHPATNDIRCHVGLSN